MALTEIIMPKMGESIMEATILNWVKKIGEEVDADETIVEIATDKVDSEIPSPVKGILKEIKYQENEVVEVGKVIAVISSETEEFIPVSTTGNGHAETQNPKPQTVAPENISPSVQPANFPVDVSNISQDEKLRPSNSDRFYSPLVRNIAIKEGISKENLDLIKGTGMGGRVTKSDILNYIREGKPVIQHVETQNIETKTITPPVEKIIEEEPIKSISVDNNVEIIEMDRMRKLIANHMIKSKQTSAHVTSFVEVDVTEIVKWREKIKDNFQQKYNEKITYTPIFIQAIVRAIQDFPLINCSVNKDQIIVKKDINIGMATALSTGNLIVPVIHHADFLNLIGLTKAVNSLAQKARSNQLKPEEIQDGTFTLTNVGTFGNVMGTPIINQPQVAILATGAIRKRPAVMESQYGDTIAIRHMMFLSLSYDHRIVDGYLGGSFLRKVGDYLENFDIHQKI